MFCPKCGVKNEEQATVCSACSDILKVSNVKEAFDADKAKEQVKKTADDAWSALKSLGLDPVGRLLLTYQELGAIRASGVGIAFGIFFALSFVFLSYKIPAIGMIRSMDGIGGFIKLLVVGFTPFLSLTAACLIGAKVGNGKGDIASKSFISGVSLLPLLITALISTVIGVGNIEVSLILFTVSICITVMILFNGLTRIEELSDKSASYIVPLMLLGSAWIAKIILTSIFL